MATLDKASEIRVIAHLSTRNGERPSLIQLKTFCSRHPPLYMIPNTFIIHDTLPKTSTNKIDYQTLQQLA